MSKNSINFTELFNYSRATVANYSNPLSSEFIVAAVNEPRFTEDGLILELASTNLLINSATPVTQVVTVTNGTKYTLASYGDGSGYSFVSSGGSGTAPIGTPITFTASGTSVEISVTGDLDYFQLEVGTRASSYIATTGTTVTRSADLLSRTLGDEHSSEDGTLFIEFTHAHQNSYGDNHVLSNGDSRAFVRSTESAEYDSYNGSITRDYPSASPSGTNERLAMSVKGTELILARNGSSTVYVTTSNAILDITAIKFFEVASGTISRFEYWPRTQTAAELEALTA